MAAGSKLQAYDSKVGQLVRVVFETVSLGKKIDLELVGRVTENSTPGRFLKIKGTGKYAKTETKIEYADVVSLVTLGMFI